MNSICYIDKPLVSVVVATRNRRKLLPRALDSVLKQTYNNIEIIVVDDASDDSTPEVASKYKRRFRNFKYVQNHKPCMAARTRNIGIKAASGKYIAFLDDDDEWLPRKLELQVKFLNKHPDIMAVSCWFIKDLGKKRIKVKKHDTITFDDMLWENFLGSFSFVLVRRKVFDKVGFIEDGLSGTDDWDFWLRVSKNYRVSVVKDFLAIYHWRHGGISTWTPELLEGYIKIYEKNKAFMSEDCKKYHLRKLIINGSKINEGRKKSMEYFARTLREHNLNFKNSFSFIIYGFLSLWYKDFFLKSYIEKIRSFLQRPYSIELKRLYDKMHRDDYVRG